MNAKGVSPAGNKNIKCFTNRYGAANILCSIFDIIFANCSFHLFCQLLFCLAAVHCRCWACDNTANPSSASFCPAWSVCYDGYFRGRGTTRSTAPSISSRTYTSAARSPSSSTYASASSSATSRSTTRTAWSTVASNT